MWERKHVCCYIFILVPTYFYYLQNCVLADYLPFGRRKFDDFGRIKQCCFESVIIQPTTDDSIQSKAIPTYSPVEIIIFINIKIVGIIIGK